MGRCPASSVQAPAAECTCSSSPRWSPPILRSTRSPPPTRPLSSRAPRPPRRCELVGRPPWRSPRGGGAAPASFASAKLRLRRVASYLSCAASAAARAPSLGDCGIGSGNGRYIRTAEETKESKCDPGFGFSQTQTAFL
jgi:hypothetical protein